MNSARVHPELLSQLDQLRDDLSGLIARGDIAQADRAIGAVLAE